MYCCKLCIFKYFTIGLWCFVCCCCWFAYLFFEVPRYRRFPYKFSTNTLNFRFSACLFFMSNQIIFAGFFYPHCRHWPRMFASTSQVLWNDWSVKSFQMSKSISISQISLICWLANLSFQKRWINFAFAHSIIIIFLNAIATQNW